MSGTGKAVSDGLFLGAALGAKSPFQSEALHRPVAPRREQRCWVHKTANVLNKMPKSVQPKAKSALHEIWQAETKANAEQAFEEFFEKYDAKYQSACDCLRKDQEQLLAFYDFPA